MGWYGQGRGATPLVLPLPTIVTTSPLPSAEIGFLYTEQLSAIHGTPPYAWTLISITPNTGNWLQLDDLGQLQGTPETIETETIVVQVADSLLSSSGPVTFTLPVVAAPSITTTSPLPNATVGAAYSQQMAGTGGVGPYAWSILSDSPDTGSWLSISRSGLLTGTPTTAETESVVIQMTDSLGYTAQGTFSLTVAATGNVWFGATLPTAPTAITTTSSPPSPNNTNRGSYYTPGVGGDASLTVQAAINDAAAATGAKGDVIVLPANTTQSTTAAFNLMSRSGTGVIYIMSSNAPEIGGTGLPAAGTRVSPSNLTSMASLRSTRADGNQLLGRSGGGYFGYRLVGLDLELVDANAASGINYFVVNFDNGDTSVSTLPTDITFDRCLIRGAPTYGVRTGIYGSGIRIECTECWFDYCFQAGDADNHCFTDTLGIGPYRLNNCYFDAQGEMTTWGGGDTSLPSPNMPGDIAITNCFYNKNYFSATGSISSGSNVLTITALNSGSGYIGNAMYVLDSAGGLPGNISLSPAPPYIVKQLTSTEPGGALLGTGTYQLSQNATTTEASDTFTGYPSGKNMCEFKVGQRVLFQGNFLQNAGCPGQQRSAFVLTVRNQSGTNPWYNCSDFNIQNNVFTNCLFGGFDVLLQDQFNSSQGTQNTAASYRILFRNNLIIQTRNDGSASTSMTDIASNLPSSSKAGGGSGGHLIFDHNTFIATVGANDLMTYGFPSNAGANYMVLNNVVWSNNIWDVTQYGIEINGSPSTYGAAVPPQTTEPAFINNVYVAFTSETDNTIPSGNFKVANNSAIGFTSYGSTSAAAGYALTSSSAYHAKGVSGLGAAYNSAGTADGTDIGCNISLLPSPPGSVAVPANVMIILQGQDKQGDNEWGINNGNYTITEPNYQTLGWQSVAGATSYIIYSSKTTTPGGTSTPYTQVATVTAAAATSAYNSYVTNSTYQNGWGFASIAPGINCVWQDQNAIGCTSGTLGPTSDYFYGPTTGYTYTVAAVVNGVTGSQSTPSIMPLVVNGIPIFIDNSFVPASQFAFNSANPGGLLTPLGFANSVLMSMAANAGGFHYSNPYTGNGCAQYNLSVAGMKYVVFNICPQQTWGATDWGYGDEINFDEQMYVGSGGVLNLPSVPPVGVWTQYKFPIASFMTPQNGSAAYASVGAVLQNSLYKPGFNNNNGTTALSWYFEYYLSVT